MIVNVLPALSGDSILISWLGSSGQSRNLLVDGGVSKTYSLSLRSEIQYLIKKGQQIDLLILSHIVLNP